MHYLVYIYIYIYMARTCPKEAPRYSRSAASSMWRGLHNTSCNIYAWASPPPPPPLPPLAATNISFDDHNHLPPVNPSPSCLCKDDVSISTSSFVSALGHHSALTSETSSQPPLETTASSGELMIGSGHSSGVNLHLWSHFLL